MKKWKEHNKGTVHKWLMASPYFYQGNPLINSSLFERPSLWQFVMTQFFVKFTTVARIFHHRKQNTM